MRTEVIKNNLDIAASLFTPPGNLSMEQRTAVWDKQLAEIPEGCLNSAFQEATRTCTYFPRPRHVIDAYNALQAGWDVGKREKPKEGKTYITPEDEEDIRKAQMDTPGLVEYLESQGLRQTPQEPLSWEEWNRFTRAFATRFKIKLDESN